MVKTQDFFSSFINTYEFSKTLPFGLIPLKWDKDQGEIVEDPNFTELKEKGVIQKDIQTAYNIKTTKFYLDILHRKLIDQVLDKLEFENERLETYACLIDEVERNNKNKDISKDEKAKNAVKLKNNLKNAEDALLSQLEKSFLTESRKLFTEDSVNNYQENENLLLSKHALGILKKKFTQKEINELKQKNKDQGIEYPAVTYVDLDGKSVISIFEMDAGYLDDFHKNRRLLYSVKGKKGSLGRRILDNFKIFNQNIKLYKEKYVNSDIDFTKVEENFNIKLADFFKFDYYNKCLSQNGIDKYISILGGESHKQERKANFLGLNQIINLHTQQKQKEQKKTKFNRKQYPTFIRLQKQILSQIFRKEIYIESDYDLIRELKLFIEKSKDKVAKAQEVFEFFLDYENNKIDISKIYLPKNKINSFAYKVFHKPEAFIEVFRDGKSKSDYVSFDNIKAHFDSNQLEYKDFFKTFLKDKQGFNAFLLLLKHEIDLLIDGGKTIIKGGVVETVPSLDAKRENLEEQLKWFEDRVMKNERIKDEEEGDFCSAVLIYSEAVSDMTRRAEIFWLNEKQNEKIGEESKDLTFYKKFEELSNDEFVPFIYLDKFGNFLKKRSKTTAKEIRLYFGNDHLLDGWDLNKELDYHGFLFRNDSEYFLGIGNKKGNLFHVKSGKSIVEVDEAYEAKDEGYYEKVEYKKLDISKFEGIVFGKGNNEKTFKELQEKKRKLADEFLQGDIQKIEDLFLLKKEYDAFKEQRQKDKSWERKFPKEKMEKILDYYITCLGKRDDWKCFNLEFKKPAEYDDRDDFVKHIQRQAYWIDLQKVSRKYVDKKVADGEMFLFKIHSKDFYDFKGKQKKEKTGKIRSNLFTHYFLELFSTENINIIRSKDPDKSIFELDGRAEIRYRPKTDEVKLKVYKKNGKNLNYIDKRDSNKEKEVIQHRRFAKDSLTLHLKIKLNFGKPALTLNGFNEHINKNLLTRMPVRVIGLDRGENNLIYYCILKDNGEIEKCGSLNILNGINFHKKLVDREEQRDWERKNWQKVTSIKTLKSAYLGAVKNWITEITSNYINERVAVFNVLEDLSNQFKRTRFFRERQVYQNFEKEVIDKHNYMVDKRRGNYSEAHQFTPFISSVEEMEKYRQLGTIAYVPAGYTSKICPKCGWRKRLYIRNSESKEKIIELLKSEKVIIFYEKEKDEFCFKYKWEQEYYKDGKKEKYSGMDEIFSNVSRIKWDNSKKEYIEFNSVINNSITLNLKSFFNKNGINFFEINEQLIKRQKELPLELFQKIIILFNLIMQIRNYDKKGEKDYIHCPSCLFDSRNSEKNGKLSAIKGGDANGAYNIARKGFMLLQLIRENPDIQNPTISNKDWDIVASEWDNFVINSAKKL